MGSGFTTFTAGNVLTASEVNNYLMEQSVMVFATTAARDSAITAPVAGMTVYITSTNRTFSYDGTYWHTASPIVATKQSTASDVSMTSTSWTTTTAADVSVPAVVGDKLTWTVTLGSAHVSGSTGASFDAQMVTSGTRWINVVSFSPIRYESGVTGYVSGTLNKTVVAGDISGGDVSVRLAYKLDTVGVRTLYSTTVPIFVTLTNVGVAA